VCPDATQIAADSRDDPRVLDVAGLDLADDPVATVTMDYTTYRAVGMIVF
jgi:hypothetical protein